MLAAAAVVEEMLTQAVRAVQAAAAGEVVLGLATPMEQQELQTVAAEVAAAAVNPALVMEQAQQAAQASSSLLTRARKYLRVARLLLPVETLFIRSLRRALLCQATQFHICLLQVVVVVVLTAHLLPVVVVVLVVY